MRAEYLLLTPARVMLERSASFLLLFREGQAGPQVRERMGRSGGRV